MKKIFMIVAMMLTMGTATYANEVDNFNYLDKTVITSVDSLDTRNYNFNINFNRLGYYLELNEEDLNMVKYIHKGFCNGMLLASKTADAETKKAILFNALDYELYNMKVILSHEQYLKFLRVLNVSINNRGFSNLAFQYASRKN